ncbi:Peptidoglycan/LPS O-acetylase OafA/YrhL, contains acyltransferase and SGNH-hydrolase domains [Asanoa hainanensis]|uniref:Peptidoglycan/LPS O-acetylase OafA/YrhL, contains acyltransferase and SGNH-hydrolase domains n=1 Tax=Asanoa hainanensis TaxID=560556 RepID=A0A239FPK4_9ACTN|nr:acyltransferase family protein [Asanoa hainanensis]SNS58841.1 Peptidoglycan/LPS O-acetylase OafA/YrhL, contains acyltransferase and SGNH-hydrolase domains [Asanoa hainanensis]
MSGARLPYQPALDGVRAFAVLAVLLFHGGVAALPGGFLGVDAFFVLSGFLITSLLLVERSATGGTDLVAFWGRRARRLLPALLLVLSSVAVVSRWLLPPPEWPALRFDSLAAVAYLANWRMMFRDGDYFAATGAPSPLQHTWSLGIEEQFYLLWPLVFIFVAALAFRRSRAVLLVVCAVGSALSVAAAAVLFSRSDVDRVYYGTDTRAVTLLVGCALAVLLSGRVGRRGRHPVLGSLAVVGVAVTGLFWASAGGGSPWLYRGGLLLVALATAAVIAHAVVSPRSPTARLLGLLPLVLVGRISYGLYLWHWPLFGWLTSARTGLSGPALLGVRLAAVFVVATASYLLVERPLRTARWTRGRPRLGGAVAGVAVLATAALAVLVTVPPPARQAPAIALDTRPGPSASATPPIQRAGRTPGALPRIAFMGDSVSWSLGTYLPKQSQLQVTARGVPGCGIARLPDVFYVGSPHPTYPGCDTWDQRWRRNITTDDPDVAVLLLDRWELMDRKLNGRYQHVGEPEFDAYLLRELNLAIDIVGVRGARVAVLTAPYTRRAERPDGGLWPEDEPARVDAWNRLLRATAAKRTATVLDLQAVVCPGGAFAWDVGGVRVRSDGLHFTPEGVQQVIAPWLLPQVARLATA